MSSAVPLGRYLPPVTKQVVAELESEGKTLPALRSKAAVAEQQPCSPARVARQHTLEALQVLALDLWHGPAREALAGVLHRHGNRSGSRTLVSILKQPGGRRRGPERLGHGSHSPGRRGGGAADFLSPSDMPWYLRKKACSASASSGVPSGAVSRKSGATPTAMWVIVSADSLGSSRFSSSPM